MKFTSGAKAYELRGGNCAQCSLAAIFEVLCVDDENVIRAATGFADGVGLTGDGHCGALSGGTIAISYFFGRKKEDMAKVGKQLKALLLVKKFHEQFIAEFSTCRCHDIQVKQFGPLFQSLRHGRHESGADRGLGQPMLHAGGQSRQAGAWHHP